MRTRYDDAERIPAGLGVPAMSTQDCKNCRFWRNYEHSEIIGNCLFNPPVLMQYQIESEYHQRPMPKFEIRTMFPETVAGEWCGKWEGKP